LCREKVWIEGGFCGFLIEKVKKLEHFLQAEKWRQGL